MDIIIVVIIITWLNNKINYKLKIIYLWKKYVAFVWPTVT
jgi:hypothetical protein